ncbi:S1 RNA-binding domain-containing protein [Mahella australiensis]|uniref:RNA binding S1 domain protein n=1 Tax=Mahella australiensis (strain DSM 15567 / CIP 107919 / 50-1 BON) TaxID=697281 RepID=F4A1H3_MAHA5|nr:S1 RNA-binding domain-containing protein [Mahella australiensis]AEE96007.1 RNA binding S1 domain protein [Mahella australiensis 50-1 BON]
MTLQVGNIVDGTVSGITKFGAFIKLPDGSTGLVHISEIADFYVADIKDQLKENDRVRVKVLSIGDDGKIRLSIKKAKQPENVSINNQNKEQALSFEDRLAQFLKDSEERLNDLKQNQEAKQRGGYSRRYV